MKHNAGTELTEMFLASWLRDGYLPLTGELTRRVLALPVYFGTAYVLQRYAETITFGYIRWFGIDARIGTM